MEKNRRRPLLPQHEMQAAVRLNSGWQTRNEGGNWNNIFWVHCARPALVSLPPSGPSPKSFPNVRQIKTKHEERSTALQSSDFWWAISAGDWGLRGGGPLTGNMPLLWAQFRALWGRGALSLHYIWAVVCLEINAAQYETSCTQSALR